jgi:PAS domain S-box-containing protein
MENNYEQLGEFVDFTVLVLEDDDSLMSLYQRILHKLLIRYKRVRTISEATEIIQSEAIDCIIVDLRLETESGLEISEVFDPAKCVIVSGFLDKNTILAANLKGFSNLITKPVSFELLSSVLRKLYWSDIRRVSSILDESTDFICRCSERGVILFVNARYCSFFGVSMDAVVGTNFFDLFAAEEVEQLKALLKKLDQNNPIRYIALTSKLPNESTAYCKWGVKSIYSNDSLLIGYQLVGRDVTETHHAMLSVQKAESKYRNLFDNAPNAMLMTDSEGTILECNSACLDLLNCQKFTALEKTLFDFTIPSEDTSNIALSKLNEAIGQGESFCEIELQGCTGRRITVWMKGKRIYDNKSRLRLLWYFQNISEIYHAKLLAEDAALEKDAVLSSVPAPITIKDEEARYVHANKQFLNFFDVSLSDVIGKTEFDFELSGDPELCYKTDMEVLKGARIDGLTFTSVRDNVVHTFTVSKSPIYNSKGVPKGIISVGIDITSQLRTEYLLKDIFTSMRDGILVTDADRSIIKYNKIIESWFPESTPILGKKCHELFFGAQEACENCPHRRMHPGDSYKVEWRGAFAGSDIWREVWHYPLMGAEDKNSGTMIHVRDITELKTKEMNLKYVASVQSLISEISRGFVGLPLDKIDMQIKSSLRKIVEFSSSDRAYIYIEEDDLFVNYAFWRTDSSYIPSEVCVIKKEDMKWLTNAIGSGCYLRIDDVTLIPDENGVSKFFAKSGCRSALFVPFVKPDSGRITGFLGIDMVFDARKWDSEMLGLLSLAVEVFSNALIRRVKEEQYKELYTLLRELCDDMPGLLWATDNEGKILFANKLACDDLLLAPYDSIIDRKFRTFVPIDFYSSSASADASVASTKSTQKLQLKAVIEGNDKWFDITKTPFCSSEGAMVGIINFAQNITDSVLQRERVMDKTRELEELTRKRLTAIQEEKKLRTIELTSRLQQSINLLDEYNLKEQSDG